MKPVPQLYTKKEDCCGCAACVSVCALNAIAMKPDREGFDYPVIDAEKCFRCYQCVNVCPLATADNSKYT